ncbi:MAG: hypothetical protein GF353_15265 [Candidatus Lokiarchaeota archaeon]|nr:hypothetical protein [Candidatus Lokiarchaeota archaeon]
MFDEQEFQEYPSIIGTIKKLNKFFEKQKLSKLGKKIHELLSLIEDPKLAIPITYVLSIIAEKETKLISQEIIEEIKPFLKSSNKKIKLNSIIILGFYLLSNLEYLEDYISLFFNFLLEDSDDVKDNAYYFLQLFIRDYDKPLNKYVDNLLLTISKEMNNINNLIPLLRFLSKCSDLTFNQHFKLKKLLIDIIKIHYKNEDSSLLEEINNVKKRFFPTLEKLKYDQFSCEDVINLFDNYFIMKNYEFLNYISDQQSEFKEKLNKIKENANTDKEIYFYLKFAKEKVAYIFEIERDKLLRFFNRDSKISMEEIESRFENIINKEILEDFLKILMKLNYIKGYLSEFFFYPSHFLMKDINETFQKTGIINIKSKYNYLPPKLVYKIVSEIDQPYLLSPDKKIYYSIDKIKYQINSAAAKNNSIDLKGYRERLRDKDFLKLIKNLPEEYLTNFHKGTQWLTNIGKIKIEQEIEQSIKYIGFLDINKITQKLNINKLLLIDVVLINVDSRSGIWNKNKDIFYFSRYLTDKINFIKTIKDEQVRNQKVLELSEELQIDSEHIFSKIDENIKLIGEEIKTKDQIKIDEYLEKTGMKRKNFLDFIEELHLDYLLKQNLLILSPKKIESAKSRIKIELIKDSEKKDFINLDGYDVPSSIVEELINELRLEKQIDGIYYSVNDNPRFYTERGIRNLMLENSLMFSFDDLFYGRELTDNEIEFMKNILFYLIESNRLKGAFNEEQLLFTSNDLHFAKDYNQNILKFEKTVNKYLYYFNREFEKIKEILNKQESPIYPQEIKKIQESIDVINKKYITWRESLNAFVRRVSQGFLKEQGLNFRRYKKLTEEKKQEIKLFSEDPEVEDLLKGFNSWVKFFNELETKYPNIIFYKKRLMNNPQDEETKDMLEELLITLNLKG